jgi:predicted flavoprotein YhiN
VTSQGLITLQGRAVIFALGGASWPQTGSDGDWVSLLEKAGVRITPLAPANCGYEVDWPSLFLEKAEGLPLKNVAVRAGAASARGELLVTKYGLEGGSLYQLGRALREMAQPKIEIDLKPDFSADQLAAKIRHAQGDHLLEQAEQAWKLSAVSVALLETQAPFTSASKLAELAKAFPVSLRGPPDCGGYFHGRRGELE